jgi:hypothetical protein
MPAQRSPGRRAGSTSSPATWPPSTGLVSLADLDRRRHVESYLTATAQATNSRTGAPLSLSERRGRVLAIHCMLNDIAEWGWADAPSRRLVFSSDLPKLPGRCRAT